MAKSLEQVLLERTTLFQKACDASRMGSCTLNLSEMRVEIGRDFTPGDIDTIKGAINTVVNVRNSCNKIDLSSNNFEWDITSALFAFCSNKTNVRMEGEGESWGASIVESVTLDISDNDIQDIGAASIGEELKWIKHLNERLKIVCQNNGLTTLGFKYLAKGVLFSQGYNDCLYNDSYYKGEYPSPLIDSLNGNFIRDDEGLFEGFGKALSQPNYFKPVESLKWSFDQMIASQSSQLQPATLPSSPSLLLAECDLFADLRLVGVLYTFYLSYKDIVNSMPCVELAANYLRIETDGHHLY